MPTPLPTMSPAAALVQRYAELLGASDPAAGRRLTLTIDGRYRIQLRPQGDQRVQAKCRLRALPAPGAERDQLILALGRLACGTMNRSSAACVVDADERALWLSQVAPATSTQEVDELVAGFVNELAFWTRVVPQE